MIKSSSINGFEFPGVGSLKATLEDVESGGRRKIREEKKEVTNAYREAVVYEQVRVAQLVEDLYREIAKNPEQKALDLFYRYVESSPNSFSEKVKEPLKSALENYESKHEIVKRFYKEQKDPAKFFEACFGARPKGQVELIPGPMTLCFRCFDEEDYIYAFAHSKEPIPHGLYEEIEKAKKSGGAALFKVKIPELEGIVTLEKASNNKEKAGIFKDRKIPIPILFETRWHAVQYPKFPVNTMEWKISEQNISIRILRNGKGEPQEVIIGGPGGSADSASAWPEGTSFPKKEINVPLPVERNYTNQFARLKFFDTHIQVSGKIGKPSEITHREWVGSKWMVKDKEKSKQIRVHEEQHQFNKLFVPNEQLSPLTQERIKRLLEIVGNDGLVANSKQRLLHALALFYRQWRIDPQLRDEIIAYYKDGRDLKVTQSILKNSSLYKFKNGEVKIKGGQKMTEQEYIVYLMDLGLRELAINDTMTIYDKKGLPETFMELENYFLSVEPKEIEEAVKQAVEEGYYGVDFIKEGKPIHKKGLLEFAVAQIEKLEKIGYKREQIIGVLSTQPLNRWPAVVRKLLKTVGKN